MEKTHETISRKKITPSSSIDRLSAFPDEIICHILSFLPTKTSGCTSILARRWRFLWADVPSLHFVYEREEMSIDTIYNKVLLLYRARNLNVFRLHSDDSRCSRPQLQACIEDAINRNVKQIDLRLLFPNCFPSRMFACRTVVEMELSGHGIIPTTTEDMCLPALKKLRLCRVEYESPESLPHLLSCCPVLEELTIFRLSADVYCLVVSSSTINRLDINSSFVDYTDTGFTLKIDTPAVRYLEVNDVVSKEVSAGMLASLIQADVSLDNHWLSNGNEDTSSVDSDDSGDDALVGWGIFDDYGDYFQVLGDVDDDAPVEGDDAPVEGDHDALNNEAPKEEDVLYARSVLEFVGRLSNVKYLKFTTRWMDVSDSEFSTWSAKFHNLTKLELRSDWRFISNFLENADNLESLTIRGDDEHLKHWIEPKEVPACLLSHLGFVRINSFGCGDQEFHMIKYILRNAKVLKRMEIHFECDGIGLANRYEGLKKIPFFPRGSVECELGFY